MATTLPPRDDCPGLGAVTWPGVVTNPGSSASAWKGFSSGLPNIQVAPGTLRELLRSDAGSLAGLLADPAVARHLAPPPSSVAGFERFIDWSHERRLAGECCCFGIVPSGTFEVAGFFQIRRLDADGRLAEWGVVIGRPYWGSGLFDPCAEAVIRFSFESLGIHRLDATISLGNDRADAVMRRLGGVQTGFVTHSTLSGAPRVDGAVWSLTPGDWRDRLNRAVRS